MLNTPEYSPEGISHEINPKFMKVEEEGSFSPTFPSATIRMSELVNGMQWGKCKHPIEVNLNASLPDTKLGETTLEGGVLRISINSSVPEGFKHIVACHELTEAECISNGIKKSHDIACGVEKRYLETYCSASEIEAYEALMGKPEDVKNLS